MATRSCVMATGPIPNPVKNVLVQMFNEAMRQGEFDKAKAIKKMISLGTFWPYEEPVRFNEILNPALEPVKKKRPLWKKRNAEFPWGGWIKEGDDESQGLAQE